VMRLMVRTLLFAGAISMGWLQAAQAAEILYYLTPSKDTPKEKWLQVKTPEGDTMIVAAEPVARVSSDEIKSARIEREEVEVLDEDDPVSEIYRVRFGLDETADAKLARTMDELCKTKPGVHIVVDGVAIDYRPFVQCGKFEAAVSFLDKASAEQFAHKFAKDVSIATPSKN